MLGQTALGQQAVCLLQDLPALREADAVDLMAEVHADRELAHEVAGRLGQRERLPVGSDALVQPAEGDQHPGRRVARVRPQHRVARGVGRLLARFPQGDQPLLAASRRIGAPGRLPAEEEQDDRAGEQALRVLVGLALEAAGQRRPQAADGALGVPRRLTVGALRERRLRDLDEAARGRDQVAGVLVVLRDLEQRVAWRRPVVGDERLQCEGGGLMALPAVVGGAGDAAVEQLLEHAGIEGVEVRAIAPPVFARLDDDHAAPLLELPEAREDLVLVLVEHREEHRREEAAPLDRAGLEQRQLVLVEVRDARAQQFEQRVGRRRVRDRPAQLPAPRATRDRPVERPAVIGLPQHGELLERRQILLEEQRAAVRAVQEPAGEVGVGCAAAVARAQHRLDRVAPEVLERDPADRRPGQHRGADARERVPVGDEILVVGDDQEQRAAVGAVDEAGDHLGRRPVDPMRVIEDDHERDLGGHVLKGNRDVRRPLGLLRLVVSTERVDTGVGGCLDAQRRQLPDHRDQLDQRRRDLSDQLEHALGSIGAALPARQRAQHLAERAERVAGARVIATDVDDLGPRRRVARGDGVDDRVEEERLPAPRRTGQEHDRSTAGDGLTGGRQQRIELALSPDRFQRRHTAKVYPGWTVGASRLVAVH